MDYLLRSAGAESGNLPIFKAFSPELAIASLDSATRELMELLVDVNSENWEFFFDSEYSRIAGAVIPEAQKILALQSISPSITSWAEGSANSVIRTMKNQVVRAIERGFTEGAGISEIAKDIRIAIIGEDAKYPRAFTIARTESARAGNSGKFNSYLNLGQPVKKLWIPGGGSFGRDDRPWHTSLGALGPVPIQDYYQITDDNGRTEFAQYPQQDTLSAYNVVNCACTITEVLPDGI